MRDSKNRYSFRFSTGLMRKIMKMASIFVFVFFSFIFQSFSQIVVTGTVTAVSDGSALPGVTIREKGTNNGAITDIDGKFSLSVANANSVLVFSFIGMAPKEVTVGTQTKIAVAMDVESTTLNDIVVTALGIEKKAKGLTYSTQKVSSDDVTNAVDQGNMINGIEGKVAGVQLTRSYAGDGGSTRVVMRGSKSLNDNDKVLYVIDGVPINNDGYTTATSLWQGHDGGDAISNINPDDIESMTVLKGASAAALYGSGAANGCILITTKKGKAGQTKVDYSLNVDFGTPAILPQIQTTYGQTSTGALDSWGAKTSASSYNPSSFFQTAVSTTNSVSLTTGNDKMNSFISYANTSSNGLIPNNTFARNNFSAKMNFKVWDKVSVDADIKYTNQITNNRPQAGYYFNPICGIYTAPRGLDISTYQQNFETYNPTRNLMANNWFSNTSEWDQNPWWIVNRNNNKDVRDHIVGGLTLKYDIIPGLYFQVRGNYDYTQDSYEQDLYATTTTVLTSPNGGLTKQDQLDVTKYGDAILNYNKTINDFGVNVTLGSSVSDFTATGTNIISGASATNGLYYANFFQIDNVMPGSTFKPIAGRSQLQAVFASGTFSFKDYVYLELTGRNDWSSTLPSGANSYFYPSAGLTFMLNELLKLPATIVDMGKLRVSASQVGSSAPPFVANPQNSLGNGGTLSFNTQQPVANLKPELTTSYEVGTEWRFFKDRLNFDFTYYVTDTKDQLIQTAAPASSQYSIMYLNAGDIQNKGVELSLGITPVNIPQSLKWKTTFNFTKNINTIKSFYTDPNTGQVVTQGYLYGQGDNQNVFSMFKVGGSLGDLYGYGLARTSDGSLIVNSAGLPEIQKNADGTNELLKIGNANPDWTMGWNNSFSYKDFTLGILIDFRYGGTIFSATQQVLDGLGVSQASANARDNGGVDVPAYIANADGSASSTKYSGKLPAQAYYELIGGRGGLGTAEYGYSATNIRVRELTLTYNLPKNVIGSVKFIKNASVSLVSRNPFFIMNKCPVDPDIAMSTSTSLQGFEAFTLPSQKTFGFNLKIGF